MLLRRHVIRMVSMLACLALMCAIWAPAGWGLKITAYSEVIESGNTSGLLKSVTILDYNLSPVFHSDMTDYEITVPHEVSTLTVAVESFNEEDMVYLNDSEPVEGGLVEVGLSPGDDQFTLTVIAAQQGSWTYYFNVKRPAKTFVVNSTEDSVDALAGNGVCADEFGRCTLRAAIMEANATSAMDTIYLQANEYLLTLEDDQGASDQAGDLDVLQPLTIIGDGAETTTIHAQEHDRVFFVTSPFFHLSGVRITGGVTSYGGGINLQGFDGTIGTYTIQNTVFEGNTAEIGAAIYTSNSDVTLEHVTIRNHSISGNIVYIGESSSLHAQNVVFQGNQASGGALFNVDDGYVEISNSQFISNLAGDGGAIFNSGEMSISNSAFEGNEASWGGAIYNTGHLNIQHTVFEGNVADYGGAIYNETTGELDITRSEFESNKALYGGAIDNLGVMDVSDSLFAMNRAEGELETVGGAIRNEGPLTLTRVEFNGNEADGKGGAVYSDLNLVITDSYIHDNRAEYGGGLYLEPSVYTGSTVMITGTTFSSNEANYSGGGASLRQSVRISNSTFTGNQAGSAAGGLEFSGERLVLSHSTVADNLVTGTGSGQGSELYVSVNQNGRFIVSNTIIWGSDEGIGLIQAECEVSLKFLGMNIIRDDVCNADGEHQHIINVDPMLVMLADNGGFAPTRALLPGSPAIDAGRIIEASELDQADQTALELLNPHQDQRGHQRTGSGYAPDIGAYEFVYEPYALLAYYDASRGELHVRFGSKLITDESIAPLAFENFQVSASEPGMPQQRLVEIEAIYYGDDEQSIVLYLTEVDESESLSIRLENNAVKFANDQPGENKHAYERTDSVLTPVKLTDVLLGLRDNNADERPLHIGDIARALSQGLLNSYLGDFHYDPVVVRYLLTLIRPHYVSVE